jgi:hypothetical protein
MLKRWPALAIAAWLALLSIGESEATVEEQRARLPPPAECHSAVAGRWKSLHYRETYRDWYEFVLEVHEDPADKTRLVGKIQVHMWVGESTQSEPRRPCLFEYTGTMEGGGSFANGQIAFGATSPLTFTQVTCGNPWGYNPDHFTGKFEPERQEFQSVNNDGGSSVNEPVVFRRIGCFDDAHQEELRKEPPHGDVAAPPFFPKHKAGC